MLPEAYIIHKTSKRLRIKIPLQKGNADYFLHAHEKFSAYQKFASLKTNALTGSLLITDEKLDSEAIKEFAEANKLFTLQTAKHATTPLSIKLVKPVGDLSSYIKRSSGGELDLPGLAFILLLGVGLYQVVKGNFTSPPWYTAFWYAMGVFTKFFVDKGKKDIMET